MESIVSYFQSLGLDFYQLLQAAAVLLVGTILIGAIGRFIFGKKSALSNAVSSAIGIIFIYVVSVLLMGAGDSLSALVAPLPFVSIQGETMQLIAFQGDYTHICSQLLSMVILAFLVNLADQWLPKGKNIFSWVFFRCLTVAMGYGMHLVVVHLFGTYLPQGIVTYAPTIVLALLLIMLLTGALKLLIGAVLSVTVNPLIGALYTFFFANMVGKQVTKAVLTTGILSGLVYLLNQLGITGFSIAAAVLATYIPFLIVLVVLWYLVNRLF